MSLIPARRHLRRTAVVLAGAAAVGVAASFGVAPASASDPNTASHLNYTIQDPSRIWASNCTRDAGAFTPTLDATNQPISRVLYGVSHGASYHIEVPSHWNGKLVLFAHGYNGTGTLLCAGVPNVSRSYYMSQGYAWAASSYSDNGYDVAAGVKDTHDLLPLFTRLVGKPSAVYMTGESMGGQITAVEIEQYPKDFVAAMPTCGVLADDRLFDTFLDESATAAAIAGAPLPFPVDPTAWDTEVAAQIAPALISNYSTSFGKAFPTFTAKGLEWGAAVQQRTGGTRPGFAGAFAFWNAFGFAPLTNIPFLFGVYPGTTGGTIGIAPGNVTSNTSTVYQLDDNPALSPQEQALNAAVTRIAAAPNAGGNGLDSIPRVQGKPDIPVLTLHGIDDLFVPFSMEQIYAQRVAANGRSDLLVQRAIRETNHCSFTQAELQQAFGDLQNWVATGQRPAGDNVTDPATVASPSFGCRFTSGPHTWFGGACPS